MSAPGIGSGEIWMAAAARFGVGVAVGGTGVGVHVGLAVGVGVGASVGSNGETKALPDGTFGPSGAVAAAWVRAGTIGPRPAMATPPTDTGPPGRPER